MTRIFSGMLYSFFQFRVYQNERLTHHFYSQAGSEYSLSESLDPGQTASHVGFIKVWQQCIYSTVAFELIIFFLIHLAYITQVPCKAVTFSQMLDAYHAMLGRKSITLMTHHNRFRFIFNIDTITMHFGALSGYLRLQGSSFATTKMYGYGVNLGALYRLMNITVKTFPILT